MMHVHMCTYLVNMWFLSKVVQPWTSNVHLLYHSGSTSTSKYMASAHKSFFHSQLSASKTTFTKLLYLERSHSYHE